MDAFNKSNLKGFKLIIIGDGSLMGNLRESAFDNIILAGFKKNIGEYLALRH